MAALAAGIKCVAKIAYRGGGSRGGGGGGIGMAAKSAYLAACWHNGWPGWRQLSGSERIL